MSQKFEELHISVTPVGDDKYLVRTEQAPKGVLPAEEQVVWPVAGWLSQATKLMEDPLSMLMRLNDQPDSSSNSPTANSERTTLGNLVELGQELYQALFQGSLLDRLTSAQAIAHNQGNVLRLRLGVKGPHLPRLPWEVIHEETRAIATGKDLVFSRYQPTLAPVALPGNTGDRVKILMVLAAPTDRENLALKREAVHLQEDLKARWRSGTPVTGKPPQIQLDILEQPNREELTRALEQNHYQVLHYSGHSDVGAGGGELYLVNRKTGLSEVLTGNDLAGLLVNAGIRMAVFNSCRGAYTASSDPTDATGRRSLAEALVKRGVPGVLAMAERITDDVALTLTRLFYYNIKQGYPVDLSLNRARQGLMSAYGSHELYWALPVLYLHPEFDGYLTSAQETPGNPRTTGGDRPLTRQTSPIPPEIVAASSPSPFSTPSNSHSRDALDFSTIPPSRTGTMTVQSPFAEDDPELFDEGDLEGVYEDIMYDELDEDEAVSVVSELFREMVGETDPETDAVHRQNSQVQKAFDILEETITEELPPTVKSPSPTAQNWPLPATDAPLTQPPRQKTLSAAKSFGYKWRVAIGAAVAIAIAGAGFWTGQTRFSATTSGPGTVFPPTASIALESTLSPGEQANFSQLQTPEVGKLAFAYFNEGDAIAGQKALEELLQPQRSALNYAEAVLSGVPEPHKFDSSITFLWGRLAWQAVLSGNPKYSLDDVRRYWTRAVQQEPNNPTYYNALGFAYYADGNFTKAEDAWMESLKILEKMPLTGAKNSTNPESAPLESYDALTAYAGFSLILSRSASELPPGDRAEVLSKAIKLRKIVLNADPLSFQPDALATDWMWPESALEDWRSLLMTRE